MDLMLRVNVQLALLVLPRLLGPILRVTVLDRLPPPAPATFTDLMPQANVQLALLGLQPLILDLLTFRSAYA